jgi:membrane protein DedA with SNARE-associated domain
MGSITSHLLNVSPVLVYLLVGLLIFGEDALFVGFVLPGETAAVLGGVAVTRGNVSLFAIMAIAVAAAIVGDTVGYEVGRHFGTRILRTRLLRRHAPRLESAREFLAHRGGSAVFLGRFVAFLRAVMPALAGTARMPYRRFLAFNAAGGLVWGVGFTLAGYLAGNSYAVVERTIGRAGALAVAGVAVIAFVVWRIRRRRNEAAEPPTGKDAA